MGTEVSNSIFPSESQLHSYPAPDTALSASVSQCLGSRDAAAPHGSCREAVPSKAGGATVSQERLP